MKEHILKIREALHARLLDIQKLIHLCGASRELALSHTTTQQARVLLGDTLRLMGEDTPYPKSDDPTSKEVAPLADTAKNYSPDLPADKIAAVKTVRQRLGEQIEQLGNLRRQIWARNYDSLAELVFDRAYTEVTLAKNWLGMELSALAAEAEAEKIEAAKPKSPIAGAVTADKLKPVVSATDASTAKPSPVIPPPSPATVTPPTPTDAVTPAAAPTPALAPVVPFETAAAEPVATETPAAQVDTAAAVAETPTATPVAETSTTSGG